MWKERKQSRLRFRRLTLHMFRDCLIRFLLLLMLLPGASNFTGWVGKGV